VRKNSTLAALLMRIVTTEERKMRQPACEFKEQLGNNLNISQLFLEQICKHLATVCIKEG
jgi:hypothetical protein